MLEDLLEGPPAHPVVPADLSLGDPLDEHLAPDLCPLFHVGVHPSPVCSPGRSEEASGAAGEADGDEISAEILRKNVTSPGGTTQAALDVLMAPEGLAALMARATAAAARRAGELSG